MAQSDFRASDKRRNGKKGSVQNSRDSFVVEVNLKGGVDDQMNQRFAACVKNDFPICLDEALKVIFASSERESVDLILRRVRGGQCGDFKKITTPRGIWELYKKEIGEFQRELGDNSAKKIETESVEKMKLMHCQKCPLYEFELKRLQEWYK